MSFCAFPSARRPVRRRPPLAINFTDLVKIEEHTDKMISSLKQSNHATTPLHTTDIIASEYMYPSSTTPIRSEHLSINSSRDSVLSINDIPSLGFQSQDDLDTPLSSLASSPSAHHYPLTSLGNADLPLQIAGKSATEQLRQWKSSAKQHQGAQPQGSSSRKGIGSVSSHKNAKSDISAKLSKSLPPLPPQLNSRHLLHSDDSRESVAQKIASIGGKASRDNSRSRSTEQPHEARRAVSAEERSKGLDTALPPLKVKTSQKALPTAPLKLVPLSRPELLQDNKLNLQSRTSSSHSDVLFSFQDLQSSGQASSDSLVLPLAHIKQPMRPQNLSQPSTGLHAITAMTSKPIICENPFVNKASDAGQRAARVNPKVKAIVPSIPATNPMVDDRENPFPNVFLTQSKSRRPTQAPPLTAVHFLCYQSHRNINNSKNDIAQVPCMTCKVDDRELRWKCSWCCLRICTRCMEVLEDTKDRNLNALLRARPKAGFANQPWHSIVREGITDGPSF